ncbi:DUF421 domain-containing protein [Hymenobacter aerilatus]|uniref:DUF421 domain-containing protein n=1 Tax=Hymenobacter aerilatus TaxID=2932251 RepID=A0A8T9SY63_9BACT|nr:YetF domain-containing protein [Hymenobacter aerilatus]UOR06321.1 DUF421 domain-containing protein [Hymenobacter aerilatus]
MFDQVDWHAVFVPNTPLLEIVVRGTLIYLGLFLLLRVVLKRESGTLGITDMLFVVMIADAAQNGMAGEYRSVTEGILLVGVIICWSYFLNWLGFHYPLFQRLIKPAKLLLIRNGQLQKDNMRKELITRSELMSELRTNGLTDISGIKEAYMEPTGRISIIRFEEKQNPPSEEPPL